jgi:DNA modification methylase
VKRDASRVVERDPEDRHGVLQVFGREFLASGRQDRLIARALEYWRSRGFPYPRLTTADEAQEFRQLQRVSIEQIIQRSEIRASTIGLRLANSYHPQIWDIPAGRHKRSPIDHFDDDETLRKILIRAAGFWPNRRCWNAQCLRGVVRIYGGGRVANFRPTAARAIISRYSSAGDTVLDFSAGFGGRLLGCLTLERHYVGIDPAAAQIRGLRMMARRLRDQSEAAISLVHGCAEDVLRRFDRESVDLVFSSPPYFNMEKYSREDNQSYRRYKTYTIWKERFLSAVITDSHRILRRGGHLVLNVANTARHPVAGDIAATTQRMFKHRHTLHLLMNARPFQRSTGICNYRSEPIYVFKKTS